MASQWIDLSEETMLIINVPLVFFNLAANIFYIYCLISNRQKLKQPLVTLLGCLVWCTTAYFVFLVLMYFGLENGANYDIFVMSWIVVLCCLQHSTTCSVWLNFYYFVLIVPSQRALFIWIKKNVKAVVYTVLFLSEILILFNGGLNTTIWMFYSTRQFMDNNGTTTMTHNKELYIVNSVCFWLVEIHLLVCLFIMTFSSFFTVHYLYGHIRRMAQGGGCFSCPKTQSQIRVTLTGISQGVLYFMFGFLQLFSLFITNFFQGITLGPWLCFTFSSLYLSGTTVNLGIGQTAFREMVADVWKTLKALGGY